MPARAQPAPPPAKAHTHNHDASPPKALLIACAALVVFALMGVSVVRLTGTTHTSDWRPMTVETLTFRFADAENGAILAINDATGALVHRWDPATGGFVRTSLRSLAQKRDRNGVGQEPAFALHLTANGNYILEDPSTGQWVALDAFGKDNVSEFDKLFHEARILH
ncbi:photosynthetic complex assembly protein PuhC [Hyphomonas sp.]|uniref:photosynthetic complex assembly protein PuhC n=1 Tax=Hyphomonas sp. TaxID=87 RepID=UPI00391A4245